MFCHDSLFERSDGSSQGASPNQVWGLCREKFGPQVKDPLWCKSDLGMQSRTSIHVVFIANVDALKRGEKVDPPLLNNIDVREGAPIKEIPVELS